MSFHLVFETTPVKCVSGEVVARGSWHDKDAIHSQQWDQLVNSRNNDGIWYEENSDNGDLKENDGDDGRRWRHLMMVRIDTQEMIRISRMEGDNLVLCTERDAKRYTVGTSIPHV